MRRTRENGRKRAARFAEALSRFRSRLRDSDFAKSVADDPDADDSATRRCLPSSGANKELAELQQRLNAAIAGECQFVAVGGEPGIGKIAAARRTREPCEGAQDPVSCTAGRWNRTRPPLPGFLRGIQEYFRLRDSSAARRHPIFRTWRLISSSLFPVLIEISDIRSAATGESKHRRERARHAGAGKPDSDFRVARANAYPLAGGKPLVLFLEDLHAADISLEALQYIVRRLGPTPTLIVGTYRSSEVDNAASARPDAR